MAWLRRFLIELPLSEHGTPTETSRSRQAYAPPIKLAYELTARGNVGRKLGTAASP